MTLENAWKAAARAWYGRLVVAREDADKLRRQISGLSQANREAHAGIAARREREAHLQSAIERRNAQIKDMSDDYRAISLARDRAENERDIANTCADVALKNARILGSNQVANDELAPLAARIIEADRKHPCDLSDGAIQPEESELVLRMCRKALAAGPSWTRALSCELAEALYALAAESPERLADELLDVAALSLRWRRAILERTNTGE